MSRMPRRISRRSGRQIAVFGLLFVSILMFASEIEAQRRGGGMRGGGRMNTGGGVSRGGPARGGSVRHERSGGSYRSGQNNRGSSRDYKGSRQRDGGGLGDRDREFGQREPGEQGRPAERPGGRLEGDNGLRPEAGNRVGTPGSEKRTPDGYVIKDRGNRSSGADSRNRSRDSDASRARASAQNGGVAKYRNSHCNGSRCYGGRSRARRRYYNRHSYYYYPYYYGWYSCPPRGMSTWHNRYGTPVYGCANVIVISTTISMGGGPSETDYKTYNSLTPTSSLTASEASVSSAPVLMYEAADDVPVYRTTYKPSGVNFSEKDGMYYWAPGPSGESEDAEKWNAAAAGMKEPTANSTVITYTVGDRIVYLTNEEPLPGYFSQSADKLFVWIPGVKDPTDEERALIVRVIRAHEAGGKIALDREVRKLEKGREPPPSVAEGDEGDDASGEGPEST
jgi:hypothetical protein